jgi:predicted permease
VAREATVDLRVVLLALAIALTTGVVAGLLPAVRAARRDLADTLKTQASQPIRSPRQFWGWRVPSLADGLVTVQVALSVVLLVVAGLVIRTLASVGDLDPGFSYDHLVVTHISTSSTTLKVEERDRFFREVARQIAEEPWAGAATVADFPPLSPHPSAELMLDGQTEPATLVYSKVIPGFFEALGIEVRQGRTFGGADTTGATKVAVVNELLAKRFFAGGNAVGRRIRWPGAEAETDRVFEIVGVVADMKMQDFLAQAEPTVFFSYPQHGYPTGSALLVSAVGDPAAAVPLLYRWLRDFEPHLAIVNVVPYSEVVRGFLYTHRMNAEMFSALAFLGLALATVGIFSVVSLAVARQTREIGIRTAIGAQRVDIRRLVIARTMAPVALGLAVGLGVSFALSDLVRGLLFGVESNDPLTLAAGVGAMVLAALAAAYLPTRRALAVDPVTALRHE